MIQHFSVKFGSAVRQKDMENALDKPGDMALHMDLHKTKPRIEIVADVAWSQDTRAVFKDTELGIALHPRIAGVPLGYPSD